VFFGTDPADLTQVLTETTETSYTPVALLANTTYYWQVIPVSGDSSAAGCAVNSFTTVSDGSVIMQTGSISACEVNFYDAGGLTGDYAGSANDTLTITPSTPGTE
jgi:hypothetical protein